MRKSLKNLQMVSLVKFLNAPRSAHKHIQIMQVKKITHIGEVNEIHYINMKFVNIKGQTKRIYHKLKEKKNPLIW